MQVNDTNMSTEHISDLKLNTFTIAKNLFKKVIMSLYLILNLTEKFEK